MKLIEFAIGTVETVGEETRQSLSGMTLEQLMRRPGAASNNMAWLAWHIARMQDMRGSFMLEKDQLWVSGGWHSRFSLAPDPRNTGRGHSERDVDAVCPVDVETVAGYCEVAKDRAVTWLSELSEPLDGSEFIGPEGQPVTVPGLIDRLVHGGLTHVGQLMYVRGLIEGRHWFGR